MTDQNQSGVSRRTLAKGAAWSVPAVAVAAVAPSVAASPVIPPPCVTAAFTGKPCRISNQDLYRFGFCITNNCPKGSAPLTFTITELRNGANKLMTSSTNPFPREITLEAGEQYCVPEMDWTADSNSSEVWIRGYMGKLGTGIPTTLWTLPAPQKVDNCAKTNDAPAAKQEATQEPVAEKKAAAEEPKVEETKSAKVEAPKKETQPKVDAAPAETTEKTEVVVDASPEATPAAEAEADA